MTAKSLLPLLTTDEKPTGRDMVFVERERHANVRKGDLSYPARAVRTAQFMYIRNLRPDRWPAGDPELYHSVGPFGDIDGGPTKETVLKLRDSQFFKLACEKRPAEELYDCEKDPHQLVNVADKPEYADAKAKLRAALDRWMTDTADPRAGKDGGDDRWDKYPYFGGPAKK
ncbi:MAG: heparan N-sulfatase, partial [Planctomycetia bacterium]|nr:heparan N-sulfatase [Planctomycetia bacterium]